MICNARPPHVKTNKAISSFSSDSLVKATLACETRCSLNWILFLFSRLRQVRWSCHSTLKMHSLDVAPWVVYSYKTRQSVWPWHPNSMPGNEFSNSVQGLTNQWALIKLADTLSTESTKQTGFHHRISEARFKLNWGPFTAKKKKKKEKVCGNYQNRLCAENCKDLK